MKCVSKLLLLLFGSLLLMTTAANAESPREQLKQMVEQLQKNPVDNALREKIIRLAQEIKPAPAVPEEAIRYEGRAQYVFSNAKNEQDYIDAAKEYERAVGAAPWVVGYYSDLCTIYEKAGKLAEAKRNCEFSLAGTSDPSLAVDVKRHIVGLEIGIERNRPESIEARKIEESKKRGVAGFWQRQSSRNVY
jgi:tetratricopeptide (TPR) repeat protein